MPQELCQCQSGTHGHEPGKCPNPATEEGGMCKRCHDESRVSDVAVPYGGARLVPQPLLDAFVASFRRRRRKKWSRRSDAAAYELTHDYDVAESGRYLESGHEPFQ
jgi:hypothetical protein